MLQSSWYHNTWYQIRCASWRRSFLILDWLIDWLLLLFVWWDAMRCDAMRCDAMRWDEMRSCTSGITQFVCCLILLICFVMSRNRLSANIFGRSFLKLCAGAIDSTANELQRKISSTVIYQSRRVNHERKSFIRVRFSRLKILFGYKKHKKYYKNTDLSY